MKFLFSALFALSVAYATPAESAYVKSRLSVDQVAKIKVDFEKITKTATTDVAEVAAVEKARTSFQQQEVYCYPNMIVSNFSSAESASPILRAILRASVANFDENNYVYTEKFKNGAYENDWKRAEFCLNTYKNLDAEQYRNTSIPIHRWIMA